MTDTTPARGNIVFGVEEAGIVIRVLIWKGLPVGERPPLTLAYNKDSADAIRIEPAYHDVSTPQSLLDRASIVRDIWEAWNIRGVIGTDSDLFNTPMKPHDLKAALLQLRAHRILEEYGETILVPPEFHRFLDT